MMYSEFVAETGCKQTEKNYEIFKELEIIYMNSNCTKEHIYEMGRKLVDNSKSEEQLALEEKVKKLIEDIRDNTEWLKERIRLHEMFIFETNCSLEEEKDYRWWIKEYKKQIQTNNQEIRTLKWVLA